jgi:hypothetical protein
VPFESLTLLGGLDAFVQIGLTPHQDLEPACFYRRKADAAFCVVPVPVKAQVVTPFEMDYMAAIGSRDKLSLHSPLQD